MKRGMMGRPITEEHCFIVGRSALVVHPFGYGGDESGAFTASVFRQYQVETMRRQVCEETKRTFIAPFPSRFPAVAARYIMREYTFVYIFNSEYSRTIVRENYQEFSPS